MMAGLPKPEKRSHTERAGIQDYRRDAESAEERREEIQRVGTAVIDSAIRVHRALGPGLLESAYQKCLAYELTDAGFIVQCEVPLPVTYRGIDIGVGYRIDMLVESQIAVENKTVESILPIHRAQLLTYLRLADLRLGYLLNWHVSLMKNGIVRMVNNL
jgi:GxxExxY protein